MKIISQEKLFEMLRFIKTFVRDNNGQVPTLNEIMGYMQMNRSVAYRYLIKLSEGGYIEYNGKGTLKLKESSNYYKKYSSSKTPIYGKIICGSPEEEEQQNVDYFAIPTEWVKGDCFLLEAYGDSMIDVGIDDGDLVLVKRETGNISDYNGKIVVAHTEDGHTLKRLLIKDGKPYLHPENSKYEDIPFQSLEIIGVIIRVIKEIK